MRRALLLVLAVSVLAAGCGKQRVATQPDLPLAPPSPPPRVVSAPVETEEAPPVARTPEAPVRKPSRPAVRPAEPVREAPKPEPPNPPQPKAEQPPAKEGTLQPPAAEQAALQQQATQLLRQANQDLKNAPVNSMNADARGQFEQAKRFAAQADQALKDKNYVLAQRLAEKAATIAAVLVGR